MLGVLFGGISTVLGNFWLAFFGDFSIWTLGGATGGYLVYNALLFPFLYSGKNSQLRPIWFTVVWVAYELFKSIGFLGYPWGLVAYSWNEVLPFIQIADIFGVYGVSFVLVLANSIIAEHIPNRPFAIARFTAFTAILFSAVWIYGFYQMQKDIPVIAKIQTILVQNNTDTWESGIFWQQLERNERMTIEAAEQKSHTDLIVWSETLLRYPIPTYMNLYQQKPRAYPFTDFLADLPTPLLTGAAYMIDREKWDAINAAVLFTQDANIVQVYGKQQLVPFAETIPFFEYAAVRAFFAKAIGLASTWLSGMEYRLFPLQTQDGTILHYGTPICFEDAFTHITRNMVYEGADFFVNLTNNAWSHTESAQTQHFAAARFRTIETRRTLIRGTNSGFTAIIDPWGRVTASMPMFTTGTLRAEATIYRPEHETIQMLVGNILGYLCLFLAIGILFYRHFTTKKRPEMLRSV
mgnify:CR=1 FL=1